MTVTTPLITKLHSVKTVLKLYSATEKISEGSEGILMEAVLEGMAEYYSAELSEKVVRGLTENAYKCKFNGGTLPLGYTIDSEHHFQIDPLDHKSNLFVIPISISVFCLT